MNSEIENILIFVKLKEIIYIESQTKLNALVGSNNKLIIIV